MIASESVEKRNVYEPGEITGARSIFDRLAQNRIPYYSYSYHCGPDRKILQSFRRNLEARAASLFFVYLSEFDGFLHRQVRDAGRVDATVGRYAAQDRRRVRVHEGRGRGYAGMRRDGWR